MKVLALGENAATAEIFRQYAEQAGVSDLHVVDSLIRGEQELRNRAFDCLLVEVSLDSELAHKLFSRVRQDPNYVGVPVIAVIDEPDPRLIDRAYQLGASDCLWKGFKVEDLYARLKAASTQLKGIGWVRCQNNDSHDFERRFAVPLPVAAGRDAVPIEALEAEVLGSPPAVQQLCTLTCIHLDKAEHTFGRSTEAEFHTLIQSLILAFRTAFPSSTARIAYAGHGNLLCLAIEGEHPSEKAIQEELDEASVGLGAEEDFDIEVSVGKPARVAPDAANSLAMTKHQAISSALMREGEKRRQTKERIDSTERSCRQVKRCG